MLKGSMKHYELKSAGGSVGYGWELTDDDECVCVITKFIKNGTKDGPAKANDVALKVRFQIGFPFVRLIRPFSSLHFLLRVGFLIFGDIWLGRARSMLLRRKS